MKPFLTALLGIMLALTTHAQEGAYTSAMAAYKKQDYPMASKAFTTAFKAAGFKLNSTQLYDGACIYALNGETDRAFEILNHLAKEKFYANLDHISKDSDLEKLHALPAWALLLQSVSRNKETLPARTRERAKTELLKAKSLLMADNGKL